MWLHDQIISHVIASEYIANDKTAVVVFFVELLSAILKNVKEIKIRTDGPDVIQEYQKVLENAILGIHMHVPTTVSSSDDDKSNLGSTFQYFNKKPIFITLKF